VVRGFVQWDTAPPSSHGDVTNRWSSRLKSRLEPGMQRRKEPWPRGVVGGAAQLNVMLTQAASGPMGCRFGKAGWINSSRP